ncbi:hypothetical protein AVEN_173313-1 [Araneus ventricosus]|uniref:Uncharacterized protein n=1 Tax=Araneus ventricosus TaxID=182803 RepID=A0A4Y2T5F0_ARAVE|nr:hypothetical protein AVEN_173313-1 [Araneus ventricosus]
MIMRPTAYCATETERKTAAPEVRIELTTSRITRWSDYETDSAAYCATEASVVSIMKLCNRKCNILNENGCPGEDRTHDSNSPGVIKTDRCLCC